LRGAGLGGGAILKPHLKLLLPPGFLRRAQLHCLLDFTSLPLCIAEPLFFTLGEVHGLRCARTLATTETAKDVIAPPDIRYSQRHGSLLYAMPPNRFGAARVTP
jgi:hypothetical protein